MFPAEAIDREKEKDIGKSVTRIFEAQKKSQNLTAKEQAALRCAPSEMCQVDVDTVEETWHSNSAVRPQCRHVWWTVMKQKNLHKICTNSASIVLASAWQLAILNIF